MNATTPAASASQELMRPLSEFVIGGLVPDHHGRDKVRIPSSGGHQCRGLNGRSQQSLVVGAGICGCRTQQTGTKPCPAYESDPASGNI